MSGFEVYPAETLKWQDGPPSLPKGGKMVLLEGNPAQDGPFVFRLKLPDGYRVPAHTHPKVERVTVISGTLNLSMVEGHGVSDPKVMRAGCYGHWPAGMQHLAWVKGETILQFHGNGPWTIEYVNPADDPRNQK